MSFDYQYPPPPSEWSHPWGDYNWADAQQNSYYYPWPEPYPYYEYSYPYPAPPLIQDFEPVPQINPSPPPQLPPKPIGIDIATQTDEWEISLSPPPLKEDRIMQFPSPLPILFDEEKEISVPLYVSPFPSISQLSPLIEYPKNEPLINTSPKQKVSKFSRRLQSVPETRVITKTETENCFVSEKFLELKLEIEMVELRALDLIIQE